MTAEQLEELLGKVTPGEWRGHNMVHSDQERQMTAEEIGEYVCNSVKLGDPTRFLFVSGKHSDGEDCDICHTGNGPRGPANTALIALAPSLARRVIAAEKLVEALDWCIEVLQNNNHDLTALQAIKALHAYREASK